MKKPLLYLIFILLLSACETERDRYYERPDWLQGPLYEQIKSTGEFMEFTKIAEMTGFDELLSSRLTFTLFVPTDDAFKQFYSEMGVSSAAELETDYLRNLLEYHTLQNSWDSVKIEGKTSFGWWSNSPDNFRTPSFYVPDITVENGKNIVFGNTFLHVYSTPFFQRNGYTETDYLTFYPESKWVGYNVDRAAVIENELGSENGFYNVIDKVLIPRTTADNIIADNSDFSEFKKLVDIFIRYDLNESKSNESVEYDALYNKSYALNMNLSNERITDNAYDGYYHVFSTVFVPENQVILDYFSTTFPAYASLDEVPVIIKKYFVEAHLLTNKKLFPSVLARIENETNDFSDEIVYDLNNGITSSHVSSNALVYGVNQAINSNAFSTVSGPIIKNPDYTIFTMMLELSGEIRSFFKREIGHVAIIISDNIMQQLGFNYFEGDPVDFSDDRIFFNNDVLSNEDIKAFLQSYISITSKNVDGQSEAFIKTKNDNYLRVADKKVAGVFGELNIVNSFSGFNGSVLEVDSLIEVKAPYNIEDFIFDNREIYSEFYALCDSAGYVNESGQLGKLSIFNGITVLIPTNEAIQNIKGSYIPEGANSSSFNYRNLIQYHIISERVIFTDDVFPNGDYGTDFYDAGVRVKIQVEGLGNGAEIVDNQSNVIQITPGQTTNVIASNGVVHIIDRVAQY